MADPSVEVARILKEHRAVLVRTNRHEVWKFPDGRIFTQPHTPSDWRTSANQLTDLRRMLGLGDGRGKPGERRQRSCKPGRTGASRIATSIEPRMLEAMRKAGLVEERLNDKIAALTLQLKVSRAANHRKKRQLRTTQGHCPACWFCSLKRWLRKYRAAA